MTDTTDLNPDHVLFLTEWATRNGAVVTFTGECGFGRECVGVMIGNAYLDYSHLYDLFGRDETKWALWWAPEDAYHKHDCMAVLGRGPAAVEQLYQWAKFLDEHNWTVSSESRQPTHVVDAMLNGYSTPILMPPVATEEPNLAGTPDPLTAAYRERAHLVALLAAEHPSVWAIDANEPDWRVVYLDLPTGQASWHISPNDWDLFGHVPQSDAGIWDGHTTEQKYERIRQLTGDVHFRRMAAEGA